MTVTTNSPAGGASGGALEPREDLEKLLDICDSILGRAFCALGDGATSPITSSVQYFRDEYIAHQTQGGCPFDPAAATVFGNGNGNGNSNGNGNGNGSASGGVA